MVTKQAVENTKYPDRPRFFSWGLKIRDWEELFLISGYGDLGPNNRVRHLDDPVAQTRQILADVQELIADAGYTVDDLVRLELTFTRDVEHERYDEIFRLCTDFFSHAAVTPATGTLRVVDALAYPGMLVEYEFLLAK